jgi:hypothetical protein
MATSLAEIWNFARRKWKFILYIQFKFDGVKTTSTCKVAVYFSCKSILFNYGWHG